MVMVRYTGSLPVSFAGRIGYREPGDVFGLSDEESESFVHRTDIEVVDESASQPHDTLAEAQGEPETLAETPAEPVTPAPAPEPTQDATPEVPASS
jgi:hypothetical protein